MKIRTTTTSAAINTATAATISAIVADVNPAVIISTTTRESSGLFPGHYSSLA